ncbi:uncharacterized protein LOC116618951 [Nematostella vectensis]|uniref:uncharacterized protein LOC116618951 n=1 Tax=Nematostella vectensis TaxID=45351 RepID=UPI00138FB92C|nr:uncharacterized protein LOC116618951 [Nematostella vectensis]
MARFRFITPVRKKKSTYLKNTNNAKKLDCSSMSMGMRKMLEPTLDLRRFKQKKPLRQSNNFNNNLDKFIASTKEKKNENLPNEGQIKNKKILYQSKKTCRELFKGEPSTPKMRSIKEGESEIKQRKEEEMKLKGETKKVNEMFVFPGETTPVKGKKTSPRKEPVFKKPVALSARNIARQKRINNEVLEVIRRTQRSIEALRNQAALTSSSEIVTSSSAPQGRTLSQGMTQYSSKKGRKDMLNVQVSVYIPQKGIQKSKCVVQESGSVEEEYIGYKHDHLQENQVIDLI